MSVLCVFAAEGRECRECSRRFFVEARICIHVSFTIRFYRASADRGHGARKVGRISARQARICIHVSFTIRFYRASADRGHGARKVGRISARLCSSATSPKLLANLRTVSVERDGLTDGQFVVVPRTLLVCSPS